LDKFLDECRGNFDYYEQQASDRCCSSTYKAESQRVPKRERYLSDGDARDAVEGMSSQQTLKVTTFYVVTTFFMGLFPWILKCSEKWLFP